MMYRQLLLILLAPLYLMLTGCALLKPPQPTIHYIHTGNDPSMVRLNEIAEQTERSTRILAGIQNNEGNLNISLQGDHAISIGKASIPKGWEKRISITFQGPFNKIIYRLATQAGYEYFTQGRRPANSPMVTIESKNQTLKTILDHVVAQCPHFIGVAVYPRTRSLIVHYQLKG